MGSNPGKPQSQPIAQPPPENQQPHQNQPQANSSENKQQNKPIIIEEAKASPEHHHNSQELKNNHSSPQPTSNKAITKQDIPDTMEEIRPPSQTQKEYDDNPKDIMCDPPIPASVQQLNQEMSSIMMTKPLIPDIESKIKNQRSHLQLRVLFKNGKQKDILL